MSYQIYSTSKASTYVITKNAEGAKNAEAAHGNTLGSLKLWKQKDDLAGATGVDPVAVVDASIAKHGFHVQSTKVTFTESES